MAKDTRGSAAGSWGPATFAGRVMGWVTEYGGLLDGLVALRELGDETDAVDALLGVGEVRRLRLSWELWAALLEGEGVEPDELLAGHLDPEVLAWCRTALWGVPHGGTEPLRAVS